MNMRVFRSAFAKMAVPALLVCSFVTALEAQADQAALATQLSSEDRAARLEAAVTAGCLDTAAISPGLERALIRALEREGQVADQRRRGERGFVPHPELASTLALVVARLGNPAAIEGLTGTLGRSAPAMEALARFGEPAAKAVLDMLSGKKGDGVPALGGLVTLRFMVERSDEQPLTEVTLQRIHEQTADMLNDPPVDSPAELAGAIDLAVTLGDPQLLTIVDDLATDTAAVVARGITTPRYVQYVQRRARARLAGEPPTPTCCRWGTTDQPFPTPVPCRRSP